MAEGAQGRALSAEPELEHTEGIPGDDPLQNELRRRAAAFISRARSFIAARSSSVKPVLSVAVVLLADFCLLVMRVSSPAGRGWG